MTIFSPLILRCLIFYYFIWGFHQCLSQLVLVCSLGFLSQRFYLPDATLPARDANHLKKKSYTHSSLKNIFDE